MELSRLGDLLFSHEPVYGLRIDSLLREIAKKTTAQVFLSLYLNADAADPQLEHQLEECRREWRNAEGATVIMSECESQMLSDATAAPDFSPNDPGLEIPLKITFHDVAAARFSFEVFPAIELPFVAGCTRIQRGDAHYLLLNVPNRDALQVFAEHCRRNPWVESIDELPRDEVLTRLDGG